MYTQQNQNNRPIDLNEIDRLLLRSKTTNADSSAKKQEQLRSSLIDRYQQSPVKMRETNSFREIDFCQIYMFLMAVEIERLRDMLNEQSHLRHIEGMQQSINQWRLKFEQKESEVEDLRDKLLNLNQQQHKMEMQEKLVQQLQNENIYLKQQCASNKGNIDSKISNIQTQNENYKAEITHLNQVIRQLKEGQLRATNHQTDIDSINRELEQLQQRYNTLYHEYKELRNGYPDLQENDSQLQKELNTMSMHLKQTMSENERLKNELYKQNRRVDTWCC